VSIEAVLKNERAWHVECGETGLTRREQAAGQETLF